jgi:steroid delta-isomerase-like uncharacterized protein
MVAEGDTVAARYTMQGTHRGAYFGVPTSGKSIAVQSMAFYRLSDGQFVAEHTRPKNCFRAPSDYIAMD